MRGLGTSLPRITDELAIRQQLLEEGGPEMWQRFMDELRAEHLGAPAPSTEPTVREELTAAYERAAAG